MGTTTKHRDHVMKVGDVLAIPLSNTRIGVGYVAAYYDPSLAFYVLLYGESYPTVDDIGLLASGGEPVLWGLTFDSKVHAGHWKVVGNVPPDGSTLRLPASKLEEDGRTILEDLTGEYWRLATDEEAQRLRYRKIVAPVRLENALKAHFGLTEWEPLFDELRIVSPEDQSRNIFVITGDEAQLDPDG